MEKENDCVIFLILIGVFLISVGFMIEFLNLKNFKNCYENNFHTKQCEKFLDY